MNADFNAEFEALKENESRTKSRVSRHRPMRLELLLLKSEAEEVENAKKFYAMDIHYRKDKYDTKDSLRKFLSVMSLSETGI